MEKLPLFFVSYAWEERYFTEALVQALQDSGLRLWFDLEHLTPGVNWWQENRQGMDISDGLVLVVSKTSLHAPNVADEWERAIKRGMPIHLVLFEAVGFAPVTLQQRQADGTTTPRELALDKLLESAASVTDARSNFNQAVGRLAQAMRGQSQHKDPIPVPLKFDIPSRFSPATGFIALTMSILTLSVAFTTVTQFLFYPPLLLWGALVTGWYGWQTANFIRRISYRGARAGLYDGIIYTLLFMKWLLPLVVVAVIVMYFARDIQRRMPAGEVPSPVGDKAKRAKRGYRRSWVDRLALRVSRMPDEVNWLISAAGALTAVAAVIVLISTLSKSRISVYQPQILAGSIAGTLAWLFFLYLRRRYWQILVAGDNPPTGGITFKIIHDGLYDGYMADRIAVFLYDAGHRPAASTTPNADYTIVLVTSHFTDTEAVERAIAAQQRLIFVLGSGLADEAIQAFRKYAVYQWVDFRLQQEQSLADMAESLSGEARSEMSSGFATRLTADSFAGEMLPNGVKQYLALYLFSLSFYAANALLRIIQPSRFRSIWPLPDWIPGFEALWGILAIVVGLWICNKIIRREIGMSSIVKINLLMTLFPMGVGFVVGVTLPLPGGYERDMTALSFTCVSILLGSLAGYFIGLEVLKAFFGSWLSLDRQRPSFPALLDDWKEWGRHLAMLGVATLFALSSIGDYEYNRRAALGQALKSAPGLINQEIASLFTSPHNSN